MKKNQLDPIGSAKACHSGDKLEENQLGPHLECETSRGHPVVSLNVLGFCRGNRVTGLGDDPSKHPHTPKHCPKNDRSAAGALTPSSDPASLS